MSLSSAISISCSLFRHRSSLSLLSTIAKVLVFSLTSVNAFTSFFFFSSNDVAPFLLPFSFPNSFLCSPVKLAPFLAFFFSSSEIASDGITNAVLFIALDLDEEEDFFSMNFFTMVAKPGLEGLDLV